MRYSKQITEFNNRFEGNKNLNGNTRAVYYGLMHMGNKRSWPEYIKITYRDLQYICGIGSTNIVMKSINRLEAMGVIKIFRGQSTRDGNMYELVDLTCKKKR